MTTREAFDKMIHTRSIHHKLMVSSQHVRNKRQQFKQGTLSESVMEKMLVSAGWKKTVPAVWELK